MKEIWFLSKNLQLKPCTALLSGLGWFDLRPTGWKGPQRFHLPATGRNSFHQPRLLRVGAIHCNIMNFCSLAQLCTVAMEEFLIFNNNHIIIIFERLLTHHRLSIHMVQH